MLIIKMKNIEESKQQLSKIRVDFSFINSSAYKVLTSIIKNAGIDVVKAVVDDIESGGILEHGLDDPLSFGKHKGKTIGAMFANGQEEYLLHCIRTRKGFMLDNFCSNVLGGRLEKLGIE